MTRLALGPAAFAFAVVAGAGCAAPPTPGPVGYISVALTAPGSGGAIYRLPPSLLELDSPTFQGLFSLDDDAPSKILALPIGDYAVSAFHFSGGDDPLWPLIRQDPTGSTATVPAALELAPMISVAENQTTALVLRFHIPSLEPITFSTGDVAVSVEVDGGPGSVVQFQIGAPENMLSVQYLGAGLTAPAALAPRLPASGQPGDRYIVTAHIAGPWAITGDGRVCAPATASIDVAGNAGFVQLMAEAPPAELQPICLRQASPGQLQVSMVFQHAGPATTPLLLDLPAPKYFITHDFFATVAADAFDGRTLRLDALGGARLTDFVVFAQIDAQIATLPGGGMVTDRWYEVAEVGIATMTVTSH